MHPATVIPAIFGLCGLVMLVIFWVVPKLKASSQLRKDPGRILFETVIRELRRRPLEWREAPASSDIILDGMRIHRRSAWSSDLRVSINGGPEIEPSKAWNERLGAAVRAMDVDRHKVQQLTAICDAMETMGASNIIPMRRKG